MVFLEEKKTFFLSCIEFVCSGIVSFGKINFTSTQPKPNVLFLTISPQYFRYSMLLQ